MANKQKKGAKKATKKKSTAMVARKKVVPKYNLADAGSAIGSMFGPAGAAIGGLGGSLISRITGFGAYKVNSNTVWEGQTIPTFTSAGDGVRICHREYITDVITSTVAGQFNLTSYIVNPGLTNTFPWLSSVAPNFEEYQFKGLVFEFRTTSGSISTNQALGTVILASNYDVVDPNFSTKQQMESYEYSVSGVPSANLLHPLECDPALRPLNTQYVRSTAVTTGGQQMYDFANMQVATIGTSAASVNLGELWVTYDVVLRKPKVDINAYAYTHIQGLLNLCNSAYPFSGVNANSPTILANNIPGLYLSTDGTTNGKAIVLSVPGYYMYSLVYAGVGITGNPGQASSGANVIAGPSIFRNNGGSLVFQLQSFTANYGSDVETVQVTQQGFGPANYLQFGGGGGYNTGSTNLFIWYMGTAPPI